MGSDDVRARAEAWAASEVDAYLGASLDERIRSWMHGGVHPDDVARFVVDGYEAGHRAALAVAPATAQPGACVAPAPDMAPRVVVEPYGTSCWQVWLHIGNVAWTVGDYRRDKEAAERFAEPLRRALLAAIPGGGDVVKEAMTELGFAPAPATAVEEARRDVVDKAKAWLARPVAGRGAYKGTAALEESIEALLAAEAEAADEGHTLAAKESRSDDRPEAGKGGV